MGRGTFHNVRFREYNHSISSARHGTFALREVAARLHCAAQQILAVNVPVASTPDLALRALMSATASSGHNDANAYRRLVPILLQKSQIIRRQFSCCKKIRPTTGDSCALNRGTEVVREFIDER